MKQTVIAAMSGGVDSSVAAAVYQQRGYQVIGATLRLRSKLPELAGVESCASKSDEDAVLAVAEKLGIEHHFLDFGSEFESLVLRPCWDAYASGRTPNPCTHCNIHIKFGKLLEFADQCGAAGVITGHYAGVEQLGGVFKLCRGDDSGRDQTYFLYRLTQKQLSRIAFPIGKMSKNETRALAAQLGLPNSAKKDSQDACFNVPGECFAETLRRLFGGSVRRGNFIYQGRVVGRHDGIHQFTIGQRKGLGVALGVPAYVQRIDPVAGNVYLTTDEDDLMSQSFQVTELNWQSGYMPEWPLSCLVQTRYRSQPAPAVVTFSKGEAQDHPDKVAVVLSAPQRAITSGQAAVFYDRDILLGGGIIL